MTTFDDLLKYWYDAAIAQLFGTNEPSSGHVLLGCPVWGKDYTERLINFCLPSIMSAENLAALAGKARLMLFVDPEHATDIAFAIKGLQHKGIDLRLIQIPEEIIKEWKGNRAFTYKILGTAQDIMVQLAGRFGLDFHMLQPDHTYNRLYWPNYFRLSKDHEAIAQIGICADHGPATQQLEKFRQADGSLSVPDVDLGNIAFRNLHKRMQPYLMNNASIPDRMPLSHFLFWQGRDKIFLSSCHMNAAHLSARLCAAAPKFMPATMDACLPALTKGTTCFIPDAADGLTFIELSGDNQPHNVGYADAMEFCKTGWMQARFRDDYLWYTRHLCEIPIKPQTKFLTDAEIVAQHRGIIDMLVANKGTGAALEVCKGMFRAI